MVWWHAGFVLSRAAACYRPADFDNIAASFSPFFFKKYDIKRHYATCSPAAEPLKCLCLFWISVFHFRRIMMGYILLFGDCFASRCCALIIFAAYYRTLIHAFYIIADARRAYYPHWHIRAQEVPLACFDDCFFATPKHYYYWYTSRIGSRSHSDRTRDVTRSFLTGYAVIGFTLILTRGVGRARFTYDLLRGW